MVNSPGFPRLKGPTCSPSISRIRPSTLQNNKNNIKKSNPIIRSGISKYNFYAKMTLYMNPREKLQSTHPLKHTIFSRRLIHPSDTIQPLKSYPTVPTQNYRHMDLFLFFLESVWLRLLGPFLPYNSCIHGKCS